MRKIVVSLQKSALRMYIHFLEFDRFGHCPEIIRERRAGSMKMSL